MVTGNDLMPADHVIAYYSVYSVVTREQVRSL